MGREGTMTAYTAIDALNWSSLAPMAKSAKECLWYQEHEREDSEAMLLGRAIHCLVLEPDTFRDRYVGSPFDSMRTKAARQWRDDVTARGVDVLTEDQLNTVEAVSLAVLNNPAAAAILDGCEAERVITWTMHGVKCKARLDAVAPDRVIDVKTCRSLATFARQQGDEVMGQDFARRLYHGQSAWYGDGSVEAGVCDDDAKDYIIAAETNPPYDSAVFKLPPYVIDAGRVLYERLLDRWKACREVGEWPGRWQGITELQLPQWAMGDEEGF